MSRRAPAGDTLPSAPRRLRLRASLVAVGLVAVVLGGCNGSWPTFGESHGVDAQGQDIAKLYSFMVIAGLAVASIVWALIFWCVLRYRRRKGEDFIPKQFQDKPWLEVTYTIIPLLIVLVIFVFTVITENEVDSLSHKPIATVTATGYQWGWIFQYHNAEGLTVRTAKGASPHALPAGYTANVYPQLVIPEGQTTKIILQSDDVIHDFYVHAFDFDRFAQPGITNQFEVTPTRVGVYPGQCSEYCGLYHSEMLFSVAVVTPAQYRSWLSYNEHHQSQAPKHITKGFDQSI